jgi:hypothetical protein
VAHNAQRFAELHDSEQLPINPTKPRHAVLDDAGSPFIRCQPQGQRQDSALGLLLAAQGIGGIELELTLQRTTALGAPVYLDEVACSDG